MDSAVVVPIFIVIFIIVMIALIVGICKKRIRRGAVFSSEWNILYHFVHFLMKFINT